MKPNCQYRNQCIVYRRYREFCSNNENICLIAEEERKWEAMFDVRLQEVQEQVQEAKLIERARLGLIEII